MRLSRVVTALLVVLGGASAVYLTKTQLTDRPTSPDFASFEDSREVERWRGIGGTSVEVSTEFPSWQTHSLRVRLPAGSEGGVATSYVPQDWHRYEALQFFVYATESVALRVELRTAGGAARQQVDLKRGVNHVQLRLAGFVGVDLEHVDELRLLASPPSTCELYLDRFRLTEYNEVLARLGRMDAPYGLDVQTPHIRWARPFARGPIRVLIVPDVAHGRAAVELAQRLECELYPVTLGSSSGTNRWGFGDFYGERGPSYGAPFTLAYTYLLDALLNGPAYDVMVLPGNRPWDEMPERLRRLILERVRNGMGLVLIDPRTTSPDGARDLEEIAALIPSGGAALSGSWETATDHFIVRYVPLESFPFEQLRVGPAQARGEVLIRSQAGAPVLATRQVGQGRVVTAVWRERGLIPLVQNQWAVPGSWHYWEYMYALLVRMVIWAARKEPSAKIAAIQLDRQEDPSHVRVLLEPPVTADHRLLLVVRDEYWETEATARRAVPPGSFQLEIPLPRGPRGKLHFVDAWLMGAGDAVVDWASTVYRTRLPVAIERVDLSSDQYKLGEPIRGSVTLSGQPVAGIRLSARLYDNYGRLLSEQRVPLRGLTGEFELSTRGCLTRLARVEADLYYQGRLWHRRSQEIFVRLPRRWEHYDIVMYLFGTDPAPGLWDTIQRRLKEMYVTTLSSYPLELSKHANFGVQAQTRISGQESPDGEAREPYMEQKRRYVQTGDIKYLCRRPCLNDPAYQALQEKEIAQKVLPWVPFSPMSYYIYEEPSLTCYEDAFDLCFCEHCLRRFREWLRGEYGTLEALNRQWGTTFSSWEEVVPDTTERAQARGNYSSWADHRTYMEITYANNYAYVRQLLRRHDPDGLMLLSGTQASTPHNGCDYSRLDFIVDHLNPYNHEGQLEIHRSFNPQLRLSGGAGYGMHGRRVLYTFYKNLFHGQWAGSYIFWQYSILNPDYRFCQSALDIQRGYRELVGGAVADLIRMARRENFGIGIHYSYPSIHAAWIIDGGIRADRISANWGATGNKFRFSRDGWMGILEDLGLQYDFVPRQWIEAGELNRRGFRVLILPFSLAISDAEADQLRAFVQQGGVLIADGQAGIMDGHAGWRRSGVLDELFGIRQATPMRREQLRSTDPDPFLVLAGAEPLDRIGKAPVLLVHRYGKGKAIYLNFFLASYSQDRLEGRAARWKTLVARALAEAGIQSPYRFYDEDGQPLENFEVIPYRAGRARLLGLVKEDHWRVESRQVRIELGQAWHVYDVRLKRYLGQTAVIQDRLQTAEPKLYALLPDPVRGVRVRLVGQPRRGADAQVELHWAGPLGVETAFRVEVIRPSGELAWEYTGNVVTRNGTATVSFPVALNDSPGRWRVIATDAISGMRDMCEFELPAFGER